jgi:hypothetical protein
LQYGYFKTPFSQNKLHTDSKQLSQAILNETEIAAIKLKLDMVLPAVLHFSYHRPPCITFPHVAG